MKEAFKRSAQPCTGPECHGICALLRAQRHPPPDGCGASLTARRRNRSTPWVTTRAWRPGATLSLLLVALCAAQAWGAPGDPDLTWGAAGVRLDPGSSFAKIVVQPDGKVVSASQTAFPLAEIQTMRRNPASGGLDTSWAGSGISTWDTFPGQTEEPVGIARQNDGTVLVALRGTWVVRFDSNGSFGGFTEIDIDRTSFFGGGQPIAVESDGSAIVGGHVGSDFALGRLTPGGALDVSWGSGGILVTDVPGSGQADAVAVQPDGKILAAGGSDGEVTVVRYLSTGALDPGFGTGGIATFAADDANTDTDYVTGIALHADGDIVIGGTDGSSSSIARAFVARLLPDGSLDTTFGGTGVVELTLAAPSALSRGMAVAAQADGKTILTGQALKTHDPDLFVARFDETGVQDPTWGVGGVAERIRLGDQFGASAAVANGRVLIGGFADSIFVGEKQAVWAFELDEFCGDGVVQAGEACDDGNFMPGDCCSPTCTAEPAGIPCLDEGDSCTADTCDGLGACGHVALSDGSSCDDGLTCTTGETCSSGVCRDGVADDCVNPLVCYATRLTKGTDKFVKEQGISLTDALETGSFDAKKQSGLCVPADISPDGITDPDTRQVPYKLKPSPGEPKHVSVGSIVVSDSLGIHTFDTKKPELLLVPATLRLASSGPAPDPLTTMHYKCYRVKQTKGTPKFVHGQVTALDEFEARVYDVFAPRRLCYAVDKNGEGILEPDAVMTCYRARRGPGESNHERIENLIHTTDQFGTLQLDTKKVQDICIPGTIIP